MTKALSIRQPWAYLVAAGIKDIENRTWLTRYRGRLLIHAPKIVNHDDIEYARSMAGAAGYELPEVLQTGGIIGSVDLVDCVTRHNSRWFYGPYGFVLENAQLVEFRPLRGRLYLFNVIE
jgi:hypothetical protein